jgi:endogenous inhibitor of DNA gyrase (YacG/DUF329 family)
MPEDKCTICSRKVTEKYKPFCSKRCADVDLARWFTGSYAIPAEPAPDAQAENDPDTDY